MTTYIRLLRRCDELVVTVRQLPMHAVHTSYVITQTQQQHTTAYIHVALTQLSIGMRLSFNFVNV